jgi:2-keto-4-pentenoate hydratase
MFIVHAFDDAAQNSLVLMSALKRANVASELHVFGAGAHGFGVRDTGLPVGEWRRLCLRWLGWQGFLDDRKARRYAREFIAARDAGAATVPRFGSESASGDRNTAYAAQGRVVRDALTRAASVAGYAGVCHAPDTSKTRSDGGQIHGVLFKGGRIDAPTPSSVGVEMTKPNSIKAAVGYVIATDIATRVRVPRQAITAVASVVPVVELPLSLTALVGPATSPDDRVAANLGSDRFIVGSPVSPDTLSDSAPLVVSLAHEGRIPPGAGGSVTRESASTDLMTLINQIVDQGRVIRAGDLLTCEVPRSSVERGAKGRYVASFGALGTVAFELK